MPNKRLMQKYKEVPLGEVRIGHNRVTVTPARWILKNPVKQA